MSIAEGVPVHQLLDDLRRIKLPKDTRAKVLAMDEHYKHAALHIDDVSWLRRTYSRRSDQIKELHLSYQRARETDASQKRGPDKDRLLRMRAKYQTRRRLEEKKKVLEQEIAELEAEEQDFGV